MSDVRWQIPPSLLTHLDRISRDRPVALLLRHSVRDRLPPGDAGNALPITDIGRRLARDLGGLLGERLRTLHTSPLPRCVQTTSLVERTEIRRISVRRGSDVGETVRSGSDVGGSVGRGA